MVSAIRPIRGGAAVWVVSLSNSAQTQFNFVSSLDKNVVSKQAWKSSQTAKRVLLLGSVWSSSIGCESSPTLEWKRTAVPKRAILNPWWRDFDDWCLSAVSQAVTHLHVCLPGRWVCWRCPCAGKNTPLWPPRSHWLSANRRQLALPRQQVVPHTEHPHASAHTQMKDP